MSNYLKPQSPLQIGSNFIYPLTTADQVLLKDGSRLNAKVVMASLEGADDGEDYNPEEVLVNAETLGGKPASDYMLKVDTAANSNKLGGKAPSEYALQTELAGKLGKTEQAVDSAKLGGTDAGSFALKTDTAPNAEKLSGKAPEYYLPAVNLLDNSDFTNPVNQRGQTTYSSSTYAIDRWYLYVTSGSNLVVNSGYITLTAHMYQKLTTIKADTVYTLAVKHLNGVLTVVSHVFPETGDGLSPINFYYTNGVATIRLGPGEYLWAALYEGEYTADTLPTYVPKGYTTELSECKRYFQKNTSQGKFFGDTSGNAGYVYVPYEQEMRAIPTLSVTANGSLIGEQAQGLAISSTPVAVNSSTTGMTVQVKNSGNTYILCAWSEPSFTLSADL